MLDPPLSRCLFRLSVHWRRQLWGTGTRAPLDLQQFNFFSALWPIQSLTSTICRQLLPVKTHQLLHVPLLAPNPGDATVSACLWAAFYVAFGDERRGRRSTDTERIGSSFRSRFIGENNPINIGRRRSVRRIVWRSGRCPLRPTSYVMVDGDDGWRWYILRRFINPLLRSGSVVVTGSCCPWCTLATILPLI